MNTVLVLSSTKKPLMPTRPARARRLLRDGKAAVYRLQPFTIILKDRADGETQPIEAKFDPGSKTTGIAVVGEFPQQGRVVLLGLHLNHRGDRIRKRLSDRRAIRRGRRGRKTRYREARFNSIFEFFLLDFLLWMLSSPKHRPPPLGIASSEWVLGDPSHARSCAYTKAQGETPS